MHNKQQIKTKVILYKTNYIPKFKLCQRKTNDITTLS